MRSLLRPLSCVALAATAMGGALSLLAQSPSSASPTGAHAGKDSLFTAEDGLDVVTYNALDLTSDGRWLAATSASRRDGLGVDYRRDGDPTYIRPLASRVGVMDTQSGVARAGVPDKQNVGVGSWSPGGSRRALLMLDPE